jgi:putative FmdB family regulatory protein
LPLFEYKCDKCGHLFEKLEKHSASKTKICPRCGAKAPRQFAAPAIQFKGSGWYVTDYGGKGSGAGAKEGSDDGAAPKSGDKPAEKSAETKPAAEKSAAKKDKK